MQRSSKYWEDPEEFRPERWQEQEKDKDHGGDDTKKKEKKYNLEWLPFGSGPRIWYAIKYGHKIYYYFQFVKKFFIQEL